MVQIKKKLIVGISLTILLSCGCISKTENDSFTKTQILKDITADEAYTLIKNNSEKNNFIILDIRTIEEYQSERIQNSIMIDFYSDNFENELDKLDKNNTYLIYCRTGRRTGLTLSIMEELGFLRVYNIIGGITQWKEKGYPTI